MKKSKWRQMANRVIEKVVQENTGLPEQELRKKLSEAYPFGMRQYHPYKIWLSAVNQHFNPPPQREYKRKSAPVSDGQLSLAIEGISNE